MGPAGRVDTHIHLFRRGFHSDAPEGSELARYDRLRLAAGVSAAFAIGYEGEPRFVGNNEEILAVSRSHPWVRPLAYLDVRRDYAPGAVSALRREGFGGFSIHLPKDPGIDNWSALDELVDNPGIVSINGSPNAFANAHSAIAALSRSAVMISHLGGPGLAVDGASEQETAHLLKPILAFSESPNVFVKVSGLYAIDPGYPHSGAHAALSIVKNTFGPDRLVWGSDFAPYLDHVEERRLFAIPPWLVSEFSPPELDGLLGDNAIRLIERMDGAQ